MVNDSLLHAAPGYIINIKNWKVQIDFSKNLSSNLRSLVYGGRINNNEFWTRTSTNQFTHFKINGNRLDTISVVTTRNIPSGITIDRNNPEEFWIATKKGIEKRNALEDSTSIVSSNQNYTFSSHNSVKMDNIGNVWLFTKGGVLKYNTQEDTLLAVRKLEEIDGYLNAFKSEEGNFSIIGSKGYYEFHPDSIQIDHIPPKVDISTIYISTAEGKQVSKTPINSAFDLSYIQNDLTINYIGINFNDSKRISYEYKLENFQSVWQKVSTHRTARFSNLPSGNYTFKVKAANADGIWSEPKSLKITIHPPWWQTWWAYLVYSLLIIGLFYYWYRSLQQKLEKEQVHNKELQLLNHELKDINIANQRFVPNDFLQILGKKSIKDLKLGDQIATKMTVLFSDIRDYTPLSESMTPEENFKFINAYLGRVGPIIKAHGGFISSYL